MKANKLPNYRSKLRRNDKYRRRLVINFHFHLLSPEFDLPAPAEALGQLQQTVTFVVIRNQLPKFKTLKISISSRLAAAISNQCMGARISEQMSKQQNTDKMVPFPKYHRTPPSGYIAIVIRFGYNENELRPYLCLYEMRCAVWNECNIWTFWLSGGNVTSSVYFLSTSSLTPFPHPWHLRAQHTRELSVLRCYEIPLGVESNYVSIRYYNWSFRTN